MKFQCWAQCPVSNGAPSESQTSGPVLWKEAARGWQGGRAVLGARRLLRDGTRPGELGWEPAGWACAGGTEASCPDLLRVRVRVSSCCCSRVLVSKMTASTGVQTTCIYCPAALEVRGLGLVSAGQNQGGGRAESAGRLQGNVCFLDFGFWLHLLS